MKTKKIQVTEEQRNFCINYVNEWKSKRGNFDGNYFQKLFGMQAQVIVSDLLKLPRPELSENFDGGYDLIYAGKKYDVKCEIRSVPFNEKLFVHNLVASQLNYVADGYIFVSYNKETSEFQICGAIDKGDFISHAQFFPAGSIRKRTDGSKLVVQADLYELENKFLEKFRW